MHITVGGYVTGFVLSVILTAIPFWLVMGKVFANPTVTTFVILGFAIVQIYVHMVFFLHMTSKAEGGWTWMSLIFTLVLVVIALSGSHVGDVPPQDQHDGAVAEQMRNVP